LVHHLVTLLVVLVPALLYSVVASVAFRVAAKSHYGSLKSLVIAGERPI